MQDISRQYVNGKLSDSNDLPAVVYPNLCKMYFTDGVLKYAEWSNGDKIVYKQPSKNKPEFTKPAAKNSTDCSKYSYEDLCVKVTGLLNQVMDIKYKTAAINKYDVATKMNLSSCGRKTRLRLLVKEIEDYLANEKSSSNSSQVSG